MSGLVKGLLFPVWFPLTVAVAVVAVACILLRWVLEGVMAVALWWLELICSMLEAI